MTAVLGINAFHGDASAAGLAGDGRLVAAVAEERFTRVKHWAGFPRNALAHVLNEAAGGRWANVEVVAVARRPKAYLLRKAWLALRHPRSLPRALRRVANLRAVSTLGERLAAETGIASGDVPPVVGVEHHLAHTASSFFCCPFEEAACLTVDGFGDFVSSMFAVGRGNRIEPIDRVHYPHSVGLFYTALTQYLGFPRYGDEYKVMGLAGYGEPRFAGVLEQVLRPRPRGRFALDLSYFRHLRHGIDMTWEGGDPVLGVVYGDRLPELLGPARDPRDEITQRHKDVAASVQAVYERTLFHMVRHLVAETGLRRLCLAGGCGQNSLANGKLVAETGLDALWVQPAAGDDGTALGAALYFHHVEKGRPRAFVMDHASWGPGFDESACRKAIAAHVPGSLGRDGRYDGLEVRSVDEEGALLTQTAKAIAAGEIVGWYQGCGEWGPRALGNRSILADPRRSDVREVMNVRIKRREPFRPFAPSVLAEKVDDWFVGAQSDAFMARVLPVRPERRLAIPAVIHIDGTGRLQAVHRETSPRYHGLIAAFERETAVPVLLNTSFNESEPIVNAPTEALDCFLRTRMNRLVMGHVVVRRCSPSEGSS